MRNFHDPPIPIYTPSLENYYYCVCSIEIDMLPTHKILKIIFAFKMTDFGDI